MSDASHRHRPRPETRATISWSRPASFLTRCTSVSPLTATAVTISLWTTTDLAFLPAMKKMSILQFTTAPFYRTKFDWFIYFFAASVSVERCRLISYSYQVTEGRGNSETSPVHRIHNFCQVRNTIEMTQIEITDFLARPVCFHTVSGSK